MTVQRRLRRTRRIDAVGWMNFRPIKDVELVLTQVTLDPVDGLL